MASLHTLAWLLGGLIAILLGLVTWEFWLVYRPWAEKISSKALDGVLRGLLILAVLAWGGLLLSLNVP